MRIALAQLNFLIGDFDGNTDKMLQAVQTAKDQGADLICFPELAISGYPPRDFLEFEDFIRLCWQSVLRLAEASGEIAIIVGAPVRNPVVEGKDLYNAAIFMKDGEVKHIRHKALLPTYDIFDEYRYFEPGTTFEVIPFKGYKIALTVCEDIWNIGNENPMYTTCPMDEMLDQLPDLIINISASPFDYQQPATRVGIVRANTARYQLPVMYVNHCGAQTEIVFDGGSVVVAADGTMIDEMPYFEECIRTYNLQDLQPGHDQGENAKEKIPLIHDAIVLGIKDYFRKLGFHKAIIGLSGGIDSALTTALATEALGSSNVHVLLMPSKFSSDHSVDDSVELCQNLGISYDIISIQDSFEAVLKVLQPHFDGHEFNVAEENIQARLRAILLMAFSNKFGYILLNTSNKSEAAVGYGTLYGDMAGGLSVIGDVYKTQVYELAQYINQGDEVIPKNILEKPPSAELRPDQRDSDSLPEYGILDKILYEYIDHTNSPEDIVEMGYEEELVQRICGLVNKNEFKRYQTPPIVRVSPKAFGMGRRMPIVGKYLT